MLCGHLCPQCRVRVGHEISKLVLQFIYIMIRSTNTYNSFNTKLIKENE